MVSAWAFVFLTALRADEVTPVQKVITMVSDLQAKVSAEGRAEAESYDEFACFCKSKTDEKTEAIGEAETCGFAHHPYNESPGQPRSTGHRYPRLE
jgi:hypothetical protein